MTDPDLLKGVTAIGKWIGRSPRAVYHILENHDIPAFKLGGLWYARKSTLREYFAKLERENGDRS